MIVAPPSSSQNSDGLRSDLHSKPSVVTRGIGETALRLDKRTESCCNNSDNNSKGKYHCQPNDETAKSETRDKQEPPPAPNEANSVALASAPSHTNTTQEETASQHASTTFSPMPLKPLLKSPGSAAGKAKGSRRVRGLWKEAATDPFANLRDETLQRVLSYLSMGDVFALSAVSSRWRYLALDPSCWKHVDATDFIHRVYTNNSHKTANISTAEVLTGRLTNRAPETITIRSIRNRLHPEYYLPSIHAGLRELTLSEHSLLSDTHVHVMFMSSAVLGARSKTNHNTLRKLALDHCPLLTNSSVQSIASQCKKLEELSLCGCQHVTDISPLKGLFKLAMDEASDTPHVPTKRVSTTDSVGSLQSLFFSPEPSKPPSGTAGLASLFPSSPPPTASPGLSGLFSPPPALSASPPPVTPGVSSFAPPPVPAPPPASPSLASLFEPPRQSAPVRKALQMGGELSRLNLSFTGVTARAFVEAIHSLPCHVKLDCLEMKGSGESWTDSVFSTISQCEFKVFDIGCSNPKNGSHGVTDTGLGELKQADLERIGLSGQKGIQTGFHTTLSKATRLHSLNLESCSSLFAVDVSDMEAALRKANSLEYVNVSRCFSDETKAGCSSPQVLQADEERGKRFLNAICASGSRFTLRELDLSWCWFVTASEVAQVQRACPKLERLHLLGTRCNQVI